MKAEFSWHPYDPLAALKDMGCFKFSCSMIPLETDKTRHEGNSSPGYKLNYHDFVQDVKASNESPSDTITKGANRNYFLVVSN